ncbi:helix-turn-helix domain-containing protein [Actinoplanes sp. NPDC049548]|uniref:helix-turn-helix domain-containing protein n=1 Tax=Actinoplanes sp. NPDC049548 TaxID=3155152 RepID=UPI00343502B3
MTGGKHMTPASPPESATTASGRGVIDGAFRLLELLPQATGDHQLSELSRLSGIPRASVYRLMSQLHEAGAVQLVDRRYVVGPSMITIARHAEPANGLRSHALPYMYALRERTGANVSLVGPSSAGAVVLEVLPGRDTLPVHIYPGRVVPDLAAAALVLGAANVPERLDPVRRSAVDQEHTVPGLHCFATAIVLPDGNKAALQIAMNRPIESHDVLRLTQEAGRRIGATMRTSPGGGKGRTGTATRASIRSADTYGHRPATQGLST